MLNGTLVLIILSCSNHALRVMLCIPKLKCTKVKQELSKSALALSQEGHWQFSQL